MKTVKELQAELQKVHEEAQAIIDEAGDNLTDAEQARFDELMLMADGLKRQIENHPDYQGGRKVKPDSGLIFDPNVPINFHPAAPQPGGGAHARFGEQAAGPRPLARNQTRVFENDIDAYNFAKFIGAVVGHPASVGYCQSHGININALHSEGVNTAGGYLVLDQGANEIINLRNSYGVFRKYARIQKMISEVCLTPRLKTHGSVFYTGEGAQITPSFIAIDQVSLIAKKPAMLFTFTRELNEDSLVNLGNLLVDEMAWSMSQAEDMAGFVGDGTQAFGGIVGISPKLLDLNGTDDGGGLQLLTGATMSAHTVIDFSNALAKLPAFAKRQNRCKWYCSSAFYSATMLRLLVSAGGNYFGSLAGGDGGQNPQFLGHEVVFTECLPTTDGASQVSCLVGDMSLSSTLGDRQPVVLESSGDASVDGDSLFERDLYALRATQRYDINSHDLGDASTAGPVIGLISAAE